MAKERSPNYPAIGLSQAVQGIKSLYEKDRRSPVTSEGVARAFGHATLSGPATSKVAAVRQYGLLDTVSPGKYRVSELAMDLILKRPGDVEYDKAIRRAALTPQLFGDLFDLYPEASDDTLRYHLIKERKFSDEGAAKVIRSFKDAVSFAKLSSPSYSKDEGEPNGGPTADVSDHEPERNRTEDSRRLYAGLESLARTESVAYSWPLGDGTNVQLTFNSEPTQKNIDILLAQLKIVREIAPIEKPEEPSANE